jgi:hypothetical protein
MVMTPLPGKDLKVSRGTYKYDGNNPFSVALKLFQTSSVHVFLWP